MIEIINRMLTQTQDDIVVMHYILDYVIDKTESEYPNADVSKIDIHFMDTLGEFHIISKGRVVGKVIRNFDNACIDVISLEYHSGEVIGKLSFDIDGSYDMNIHCKSKTYMDAVKRTDEWFMTLIQDFDMTMILYKIERSLGESSEVNT